MDHHSDDDMKRSQALSELAILDTPAEPCFDEIVEIAASLCDVPISLISLIDTDRQWFKANRGLTSVSETPREVSFCSHTIKHAGVLEIRDTKKDPRFATNPLVMESPNIRFYAGSTLRLDSGVHIGTLCVIDHKPNQLTQGQRQNLQRLSTTVVRLLEARRLNAQLVCSEQRFRALSSSAPLGIFSTTADGSCTYTNRQWQHIFGISEQQAKGHGWSQGLHPDDKQAVFSHWQRSAERGADFDRCFRIQHPNGKIVFVRAIARPVLDERGVVTAHIGSVEDISDKVVAEEQLHEERRRLNSIIEGTQAGTWEWNIYTGEFRFNTHWAQITGTTLDHIQSASIHDWYSRIHTEDFQLFEHALSEHLAGHCAVCECEIRVRHDEEQWIWVLARGCLLTRTENEQPEWMYGTLLDINERKSQQLELQKSKIILAETGALADVGGWELELATNTLTWTDQTFRIHELEPSDSPSLEQALKFYTDTSQPLIRSAVERARETGQGWDLELSMVTANGRFIWARSVGHVQTDKGEPARLIGAVQDVTERVAQRRALEKAHQRISMATENGNIGVWDWDVDTDVWTWTPTMFALYGLPCESSHMDYGLWIQRIHPEDREAAECVLFDALKGEATTLDTEFRALWPDGSVHYLKVAAKISRDATGTATQVLGVAGDVTQLRQLSTELEQQHDLLQVTLQSIGDAVITADTNGRVTWLNPTAEYMTGWKVTEAIGKPVSGVFTIVNEQTRESVENPVQTCLLDETVITLQEDCLLISQCNVEYAIEGSTAPILSRSDQLLGVVLVFHDVSAQRQMSHEMRYRATHDLLTGLVNRAEFEQRLHTALSEVNNHPGVEHALMYIDLDQFKLVNDACGHTQGDQLLIQISTLLNRSVKNSDTVARLGGDEFGLILNHCNTEQSAQIARTICQQMDDFRFVYEDRKFRVGTSIGLLALNDQWRDVDSAMQAADAACYAAKEAGRNRVHIWYDTDQGLAERREDKQWVLRLEQALDAQGFELHAQRIYSTTHTNDGLRAELLIRLRESDAVLNRPNTFILAAERFHLATRIDRWVLQNTLALLQELPDINVIDTLFINFSGQSVGDKSFHTQVIDLLVGAGRTICEKLCIEITETTVVSNIAEASHFVDQVRALGIGIALDDFGAGASSFGYLKSLNVDILKIDGQFIEGAIEDPLSRAAVRCFVDVAQITGIQTIAEFVSSQPIYDWVVGEGVDLVQGFHLHEPEPIEYVLQASSTNEEIATLMEDLAF
jgi:diguanylate cyclase (GGDEF)-like protein/PAS domain S-box-containing protein